MAVVGLVDDILSDAKRPRDGLRPTTMKHFAWEYDFRIDGEVVGSFEMSRTDDELYQRVTFKVDDQSIDGEYIFRLNGPDIVAFRTDANDPWITLAGIRTTPSRRLRFHCYSSRPDRVLCTNLSMKLPARLGNNVSSSAPAIRSKSFKMHEASVHSLFRMGSL